MKKLLYSILAGVILFTACKKGTLVETTVYEKVAPGDPKYSYFKILNVTPGSPVVNFYMDGAKFSSALSSSGIETAGYTYNGIYPDLGYATTTPGSRVLSATIIPTSLLDPSLEVFKQTITPAAGKYYTVFTTGTYSTAKTLPSYVMVEDVKPALDTTKIYVKLANFYNGSANLDLVKDLATGTKIISNVAYGEVSAWAEIPALVGGSANTVKLFLNGVGTVVPLVAAGTTFTLSKGRAYTLYTRGVVGSTLTPIGFNSFTTFY